MKKILRFQLKDLLYSYLVYGLVMLLLAGIPVLICYANDNTDITINGNGFSGAVFCLVIGIAIYKEHLQMAVQNSISRKCFFRSILCVMVISGCVCSLIDSVSLLITQSIGMSSWGNSSFYTNSIWRVGYSEFFERAGGIASVIISYLLSVLVGMVLFAVGVLVAGGYCRVAKRYRTVYCVVLPIFFFGVLPVAGAYFHRQVSKAAVFFMDIMGFSSDNPYLGILTLSAVCLMLTGICYRLLRKTEIV